MPPCVREPLHDSTWVLICGSCDLRTVSYAHAYTHYDIPYLTARLNRNRMIDKEDVESGWMYYTY